MVEKDTIIKEQFRYNGVAKFKDVYEHTHTWLIEEDYFIQEEKYEEIAKPGEAKEVRIKWVCNKKVTDYFRIAIEINWQLLNMTDVEIEIDGKKKESNKFSELKMDIKGVLEKDYNSKWGPSNFQKFLRGTYEKFIIPSRTEEMEIKTVEIVQKLKEEVKAYLNFSGRR